MKRKIILVFFICVISFTFVSGQCKIWTKSKHSQKNAIKQLGEKFYPEEIVAMDAKYITIYSTSFPAPEYSFAICFIENEKGEYFIACDYIAFHMKAKFEISMENPLIITLDDMTDIKLFPPSDIKRTKKYWKYFKINPYYEISKEQVEKLATIDVKSIKFYFVALEETKHRGEKEILKDEFGDYYYFDCGGEKSENILEHSNCILSYKVDK